MEAAVMKMSRIVAHVNTGGVQGHHVLEGYLKVRLYLGFIYSDSQARR